MKIDVYDILISQMGHPMNGIDDEMICQYHDELDKIKLEIGLPHDFNDFQLILLNDNNHTTVEVVWDLFHLGFEDDAESLMWKAHKTGSVVLKAGKYDDLKKIYDGLVMNDYRVEIRRVELNNRKYV